MKRLHIGLLVAVSALVLAGCGDEPAEGASTDAGTSDGATSQSDGSDTPEITLDPEGNPVDYLTYGAGAFPVRFDRETQGTVATAALDGRLGYASLTRNPTGPEEPISFIVELPAATTFAQFGVPPMSSFGCCRDTHIATVTVEGSSTSPDEGFARLASFEVAADEFENTQTFPVDRSMPVRWVRVTLEGRQVPDPDDYRGTSFIELFGHGSQEPVEVADDQFTGRWLTGGGGSGPNSNRIELVQDGALVTGCGIGGGAYFTISGGVENGLLRYVVDSDTVPVVAVINSEDQISGASIGRSYTRLIGEPGGAPTPCAPDLEPPPNPVGTAIDQCRAAIVYGINFDVDSDVIREDAEPALAQILDALSSRPDISVAIEGHTDSDASDEYNLDLSQRRAESVVAWLVENGANADSLTAAGKGEAEPIADNATSAGKASNRRVEVQPSC